MIRSRYFYIIILLSLLGGVTSSAQVSRQLLDAGWKELIRDNDTTALRLFGEAYVDAENNRETEQKARALLYMGFGSYGYSYVKGFSYCSRALDEFKKLEAQAPAKAREGRSRCLQLMATIRARQGRYRESIALSMEAREGFIGIADTTGTLGLIYNSLGSAYKRVDMADSSEYYHRMALEEHLRTGNTDYIATSYIKLGDIERTRGDKVKSLIHYTQALAVADSTGNRQARVSALLAIGAWQWTFEKSLAAAEARYRDAATIAEGLTDRTFSLRSAEHLLGLYKEVGDIAKAFAYQEQVIALRDSIYAWDKEKEGKALELQVELEEKDRQLMLVKSEKEIATLTNYLLWSGIGVVILLAGGAIIALRRINRRDQQLLRVKEALVNASMEQQKLKETQMRREIEFRESQLSALTLQMVQKSELMQELKERLEAHKALASDRDLNRVINKGLNHDKDWSDLNASFESLNRNFYAKLKQAYPDISPNDLKICALIKINLSIKEMANILNISPDSVKTARYRLRKKLQLNTEDNLAEFIASL